MVGLDRENILSAKFSVFLQPSQQKIFLYDIIFIAEEGGEEHITFYFCHCEAESPTCTISNRLNRLVSGLVGISRVNGIEGECTLINSGHLVT